MKALNSSSPLMDTHATFYLTTGHIFIENKPMYFHLPQSLILGYVRSLLHLLNEKVHCSKAMNNITNHQGKHKSKPQ